MADAERGECVDERVGNRRQRADIAGFAGTLDPERVGLGRHRVAFAVDRREGVGARHRVIHERAGQELPRGRIKADVFQQHLAHTLRDAAADLAFE